MIHEKFVATESAKNNPFFLGKLINLFREKMMFESK